MNSINCRLDNDRRYNYNISIDTFVQCVWHAIDSQENTCVALMSVFDWIVRQFGFSSEIAGLCSVCIQVRSLQKMNRFLLLYWDFFKRG